jgi:hypothetical protein
MKLIPLSKGRTTIVDDEDYDFLNQWKWSLGSGGRARRSGYKNDDTKTISMSRVIMNAPKDKYVDHINHNKLDNRKSNLRLCTNTENQYNMQSRRGTSRFIGVDFKKSFQKWRSRISVNGKRIELGYFDSEIIAAIFRDEAAKEHHGEFANLNFPDEGDSSSIGAIL